MIFRLTMTTYYRELGHHLDSNHDREYVIDLKDRETNIGTELCTVIDPKLAQLTFDRTCSLVSDRYERIRCFHNGAGIQYQEFQDKGTV